METVINVDKVLQSIDIAPVALSLQLQIKPEHAREFLQVMTANAAASREEEGCLRFDLLRDESDASKFMTYEVFSSLAALEAHKANPHVAAWGAFQHGDKQPVLSKNLVRMTVVNAQRMIEKDLDEDTQEMREESYGTERERSRSPCREN
jgi:autoinducer 2-degrading protein